MKTSTLLLGLAIFGTFNAVSGGSAMAQSSYHTRTTMVDQATGARFRANERGTIDFNGWKHVDKLKIKVRGQIPGLRLWANDQEVTPSYVDGPSPYYEAPIDAAVSGIQVSADQDCQFNGMEMNYEDHAIQAPMGYGGYYGAGAADELTTIQNDVQTLRFRFTDEDYIQFLRPITNAISQAQISEYSRGEIAQQSMKAIDAVVAQVDFAANFLQSALNVDTDRNVVIDLLSAKERLNMMRGR